MKPDARKGEPGLFKLLIPVGESEPARETGLWPGSPLGTPRLTEVLP